jgi:hypothetical protein
MVPSSVVNSLLEWREKTVLQLKRIVINVFHATSKVNPAVSCLCMKDLV